MCKQIAWGVALLALVSGVALIPGCGGGDQPTTGLMAVPSPARYAGQYLGGAALTGDTSGLTVALAVSIAKGGAVIAAGFGATLSSLYPANGLIDAAGNINFAMNGRTAAGAVTLTFVGKAISTGLAGTWTGTGGLSGTWRVAPLLNIGNTGSWSFTSPAGPLAYNYTQAFAVTAKFQGHTYLVMLFRAAAPNWPVNAVIGVTDPALIPLRTAKPFKPMYVAFSSKPRDRYGVHGSNPVLPKIRFVAKSLKLNGLISGTVSGTLLSEAAAPTPLTTNSVRFVNVRVVANISGL